MHFLAHFPNFLKASNALFDMRCMFKACKIKFYDSHPKNEGIFFSIVTTLAKGHFKKFDLYTVYQENGYTMRNQNLTVT